MINTNDQQSSYDLLTKQVGKKALSSDFNTIQNDYLESENDTVSNWSNKIMLKLFRDWLNKRYPILIKRLKVLNQKQQYHEFLMTLVQPEILPMWGKIVSTRKLAVLFAEDLNLAIDITYNEDNHNIQEIVETSITNNFGTFFNTIISNKSFITKKFTLLQIIFILYWCNIYIEDYLKDSDHLPYKVKMIVSTLLPIVLQRQNFHRLNDSGRALVNRLEIVTNAPKMSLSCFVILADSYKFATINGKYDNTQFICRDKVDFDRLIDWADDYGRGDEYCKLIKLHAKQINLGWYKRYATTKSKEHNDNIDNDDLYLYTILAKDTQ